MYNIIVYIYIYIRFYIFIKYKRINTFYEDWTVEVAANSADQQEVEDLQVIV